MWNMKMEASVRKSSDRKKRNTLGYLVGIIWQHKSCFSASENNAGVGVHCACPVQGGAQMCFTAVTSKSEGNRSRMWSATMDRIAFLPGSLQRLRVRVEGHSTVFVTRAEQLTLRAHSYVALSEHLQDTVQTPVSHKKLPLPRGCSLCCSQLTAGVVKKGERRKQRVCRGK